MNYLNEKECKHTDYDYREVITNEILRVLNSVEASSRRDRQEIQELERTAKKIVAILATACAILTVAVFLYLPSHSSGQVHSSDNYLIQNLRGDKINTWVSWNLVPGQVLHVNIVNQDNLSEEKINAIKDAILSNKKITLDNSLFKSLDPGSSDYYVGWQGALRSISDRSTPYYVPTSFMVTELPEDVGDITIYLVGEESPDGLSGYTKSIADGNQILRSKITIFQANMLSASNLEAITRHEFGHSLGLAHSAAPYDLMHATIETSYPYISQCDIEAVSALYAGDDSSQVLCNK